MVRKDSVNKTARFLDALDVYERAGQKIAEIISETMPPGTFVYWQHGHYEQAGKVMQCSGRKIEVESVHGRRYWIWAERVTRIKERSRL
jgi:hypothetical protein